MRILSFLAILPLLLLAACGGSSAPTAAEDASTDEGAESSPLEDTTPAKSCRDLTCPKWACTCTSGLTITTSSCSAGVCADGPTACEAACGPGKVKSYRPAGAPPDPDAGPKDTGGDTGGGCGTSGDPCSDCASSKCCAEAKACADDASCQSAVVCLFFSCAGDWDTCVATCGAEAGAAFPSYAGCLKSKGCASICKK